MSRHVSFIYTSKDYHFPHVEHNSQHLRTKSKKMWMECVHFPPSLTPPKAVNRCWHSDGSDPPHTASWQRSGGGSSCRSERETVADLGAESFSPPLTVTLYLKKWHYETGNRTSFSFSLLFDHTSFFFKLLFVFSTRFEANINLFTQIWDGIACPHRAQGSFWVYNYE